MVSCGNAARASCDGFEVTRQVVEVMRQSSNAPASGCGRRSRFRRARVRPRARRYPPASLGVMAEWRVDVVIGETGSDGCGRRRVNACRLTSASGSTSKFAAYCGSLSASFFSLVTRPRSTQHSAAMKFIETVFQKLKRHPKRIVFPGGHRAAGAARRRALREAATRRADRARAKGGRGKRGAARRRSASITSGSSIRRPRRSLPTFIQRLEKLKRYHDLGPKQAHEIMVQPNYFGAMMVQYGQVGWPGHRRERNGEQLAAAAHSAHQAAAEYDAAFRAA